MFEVVLRSSWLEVVLRSSWLEVVLRPSWLEVVLRSSWLEVVYIEYYNERRTNQGKHCDGRTPMQTLIVKVKGHAGVVVAGP